VNTDFERIFSLIKSWTRLEAGPSLNNVGRTLLDGKSFLFTPEGVLAGIGDQGMKP
jgi:hypothetical protein